MNIDMKTITTPALMTLGIVMISAFAFATGAFFPVPTAEASTVVQCILKFV